MILVIAHALGRLVPSAVRPIVRRQLVRYRHIGLTHNDAVLISYPKSGSTWLRFLLGHVLDGRELDFDSVRDALPPIGRHRGAPSLLPRGGRMLRSHEPLEALAGPPSQPIVYLVRDGRPVAVSYLHHQRRLGQFDGNLAEFLPRFLSGEVDSYGPWHRHALGAAAARDGGARLLVVRYEDLRRDTTGELARVIAFLGMTADPGRLEDAVAASSKERMRALEGTSRILQRGNTDGSSFVRPDGGPSWQELFEAPMLREFDQAAGAALRAFGY